MSLRPLRGGLREPETPLVRNRGCGAVLWVVFDGQRGPTVKAVFSLERSCPIMSLAPALAIACMVAALPLQRESPTPLERLCKRRRPGRSALIRSEELT